MPSDKRARKRAAREAKIAAMQRRQKRRSTVRRTITVLVLVGIAAGIYALVGLGTSPAKPAAGTGTTPQAAVDATAVAAGCPHNPLQVLRRASYQQPPAMTIDTTKTYAARVKTDVGSFVITFDAKQSPISVNNFVFLAQKGFYNCVSFHRVIPNFVVQGGDPTGMGTGSAGYKYAEKGPAPAANAAQQYPLGSVAMANSNQPATTDPNTNGTQFFIVTGAQGESLHPDYTLFGQVTSGMTVVNKISADGSASGTPPTVIHRMLKVTISAS